jgi:hypothetical protein
MDGWRLGKSTKKAWKGMDAWTEGEVVGRERQWIKERDGAACCCAVLEAFSASVLCIFVRL